MSLLTIGIDPGRWGAIAVLGLGDPVVYDCPTLEIKVSGKNRVRCDPHGMAQLIRQFDDKTFGTHVYLEKVHAMPKQGTASMFTFGESFGYWQGILAAYAMPYTMVTPQAWVKELLKGMGKGKDVARVRASQLFPGVPLGAKGKGRADALLLAEYGRRELGR